MKILQNQTIPQYLSQPDENQFRILFNLCHLYLENEVDLDEHEDSSQYLPLPLPPPPQEENITTSSFEARVSKLEHRIDELGKSFGVFFMEVRHNMDKQNHQIQNLLTQQQVQHTKLQQLEKTLPTELKSECQVTQSCGFESRLRQEVHDCSPGAAQSAAHCSKCVHLDGLNAENTFHSSLYSV